jgi:tetratricopeptide (TPR) repeat protein
MAEVSNGDATVEQPANLVEGILHLTGWTQTRLVHELRRTARLLQEPEPTGLQLVTVNRWKQGRQSPSAYYRRLLRCLCGANYRESAARRDRAWREGDRSEAGIDEVDEMRRRQFLVYTAALSCSVALDPEQLVASLQRGSGADARLVDQVTASVQGHARRWYSMPPESLWPLVRGELTAVNELRIGVAGSAVGRRLASLTGEVAALAGWLAWLCGNRDAAEAYYTFAHGLAGEERDAGARAFVLVLRSFLHSRLFQPEAPAAPRSLTLLHEAVDLARSSSSPFLRVFALTRRAEEWASAGGRDASISAGDDLDRAERALSSTRQAHEGFFSYWSESRLLGCRGTCAMLQGRPREAIAALSAALAATPAALTAERSVLLTDLGAAHAMRGEMDRACQLLTRSLRIGRSGDVNRVRRIVGVRRAHLAEWAGAPAVMSLDEELRAAC